MISVELPGIEVHAELLQISWNASNIHTHNRQPSVSSHWRLVLQTIIFNRVVITNLPIAFNSKRHYLIQINTPQISYQNDRTGQNKQS